MALAVPQFSFIAGEVMPALYGRPDLARAKSAASTMRNFTVRYQGGAMSRAGTKFVGFSKQTGRNYPPRMVPFQFSIKQGLALEFGHLYMRVILDGDFVTEAPIAITNATQANPCHISATNTYANGDWVFISGVGGMTQLNDNTYVVGNVGPAGFALFDVYGNPINSTAFGAFTGNGTAARIFTLTTPYAEQDLAYLKWAQSADVMSLCCVNQASGAEYPTLELTRQSDSAWTLSPPTFTPGISPPGSCSVTGTAAVSNQTAYGYVVTAVSADGEESLPSPIGTVASVVDIAATFGTNVVTWAAVSGATQYNIYRAPADFTNNTALFSGQLFGYVGSSVAPSWNDTNIVPDFSQTPPTANNPFAPGTVLGVTMLANGSAYARNTTSVSITSATGSGFVGTPVISSSGLVAQQLTLNINPFSVGQVVSSTVGSGTASGTVVSSSGDEITVVLSTAQLFAGNYFVTSGGAFVAFCTSTTSVIAPGSNGIVGILVEEAGQNYKSTDTVTFTDSSMSGSGASATLNVGPSTGVNPGGVSYFQERRDYFSTLNNPDTFWMSEPGAFTNFNFRIPTIESDSFSASPWSYQVDGIQWMIQTPGGLLTMTGQSAWLLVGSGSFATNVAPIGPGNVTVNAQPAIGVSPTVPPIKVNYEILYVTAKGSYYYGLPYQLYSLSEPVDYTENAQHLFVGFDIMEHAWCEQPYKVVWSVRNDGAMLSFTYLKQQQVAGWARHDTDGLFESVCSVTEPPVDALYLATQRFPGGNTAYMIERMDNRIWANVEEAWCVDCGLSLPQPTPNATLTASSATGLGSITGATNLVGGQNYSAFTTAAVVDNNGNGPGTGAVPTLTIVAGVITAVTFSGGNQGQNYQAPALVITDPTNAGSGASAALTLNNSATFTASAAVFALGNVGSVIRMGGGIASITAFTDAEHVIANILSPITEVIPNSGGVPQPAAAGDWTMTAPVTTISGLNHLIGATVTGLADGNVVPPTVVSAGGTITLATAASAVTIGLGFTAQLQSIYLDAGEPTIQGQRKKIAAVTARIEDSRGIKMGSNQPDGAVQSPPQIEVAWQNLSRVPDDGPNFPPKPYNALATPLRTGDIRIPVQGGYRTNGQVAIQQDNPLPAQVNAIIDEMLPGDIPQLSAPKRGQQQAA